jgi:arabinofuranosyltransferase
VGGHQPGGTGLNDPAIVNADQRDAGPPPADSAWVRWDGLVLYGSYAVGVVLTFCFSTDDPYITLRYAANLVHGHGLVYNVSQRVEGFSSPLHLVLVTIAYLAPFGHGLLKVKLLSLLFGVLTLVAGRRVVTSAGLPPWGRTFCLFLIGSSWSLAVLSGNGLETTVTCWLTTLLVAGLMRGDALARPGYLGWCAAGLSAVRPEGIAIAFALALVSLVAEQGGPPWRRVSWFAGAVAAEVVILAARLAYYHQLLPNTYFAKRGALGTELRWGIAYLQGLLPRVPTVLGFLALAFIVVGVVSVLRSSARRHWYVFGAVAAQVLYILGSGGDWMIVDRFFGPVVPMAAVLLARGAVAVIESASGAIARSSVRCTLSSALFWAWRS